MRTNWSISKRPWRAVDSLEPGPELLIINGGEHFFHGRLVELRGAVMEFVADNQ